MSATFVNIGDTIYIKGEEYVCCEGNGCSNCEMEDSHCFDMLCDMYERPDGENVFFKKIEQ